MTRYIYATTDETGRVTSFPTVCNELSTEVEQNEKDYFWQELTGKEEQDKEIVKGFYYMYLGNSIAEQAR